MKAYRVKACIEYVEELKYEGTGSGVIGQERPQLDRRTSRRSRAVSVVFYSNCKQNDRFTDRIGLFYRRAVEYFSLNFFKMKKSVFFSLSFGNNGGGTPSGSEGLAI